MRYETDSLPFLAQATYRIPNEKHPRRKGFMRAYHEVVNIPVDLDAVLGALGTRHRIVSIIALHVPVEAIDVEYHIELLTPDEVGEAA